MERGATLTRTAEVVTLSGSAAARSGSDVSGSAVLEPLESVCSRLVPPGMLRVVARCMAKDPAERYRCTHDLLDALRAIDTRGAPLARPESASDGYFSSS